MSGPLPVAVPASAGAASRDPTWPVGAGGAAAGEVGPVHGPDQERRGRIERQRLAEVAEADEPRRIVHPDDVAAAGRRDEPNGADGVAGLEERQEVRGNAGELQAAGRRAIVDGHAVAGDGDDEAPNPHPDAGHAGQSRQVGVNDLVSPEHRQASLTWSQPPSRLHGHRPSRRPCRPPPRCPVPPRWHARRPARAEPPRIGDPTQRDADA